ncbi:MAG: sarcosine oxidase subunit gamma family protein [Gammaproteobacteria bacterium]|nr:sarcosine oxidase subunit gamma family protein [Gammaproteobacteria bacterium]NIR81968.1 sarcosine oxidase subunit gamma family protein [Gammaproteobacteria bacterium]NIR89020.1 sarcosine oxidase subunit gamma family protein [Gammaproteobacteria bacterium]NIU03075.1 sarcosine oxidase subunit gamma family protein [Gammaproteobacteria bacterium]NIV50599.1 sarcosine oxidase subunit gamma family protein [Gammaproteobacteria bacterium]
MSENTRRESPLERFETARERAEAAAGDAANVVLGERPFLGHLNVRGDAADTQFLRAANDVLGLALPREPNTVTEQGEHAALWLGPDEWLVLTPPDAEAAVVERLRSALGDRFAALTDVSGGQTVITLSGKCARDVLAKGCTLDLHARAFGPGRCAQTHIAKSAALIRQTDESPAFEIVVRRSFADYLWQWLEDAAREYRIS